MLHHCFVVRYFPRINFMHPTFKTDCCISTISTRLYFDHETPFVDLWWAILLQALSMVYRLWWRVDVCCGKIRSILSVNWFVNETAKLSTVGLDSRSQNQSCVVIHLPKKASIPDLGQRRTNDLTDFTCVSWLGMLSTDGSQCRILWSLDPNGAAGGQSVYFKIIKIAQDY